MSLEKRNKLYEDIGNQLLYSYDEIKSSDQDSDVTGDFGETVIKEWIKKWMPSRIAVKSGTVLSVRQDPTNQMDCLLFDHMESPVFQTLGSVDVLPIEGVFGALEINTGINTTYKKIIKDGAKLSKLASMTEERIPRHSKYLEFAGIPNESKMYNFFREILPFPQLLVFAEDFVGNLEEMGKRLSAYNLSVGITASVDGLFVLKKGVILHMDPDKTGWIAHRVAKAPLAILPSTPGQVLLKLQSLVLKHLFLCGRVHPDGFDKYLSEFGQNVTEMESAILVSDMGYLNQTAPMIRVV